MSRINGRTIVLLILAVVLYVSAFFTGPNRWIMRRCCPLVLLFFDACSVHDFVVYSFNDF